MFCKANFTKGTRTFDCLRFIGFPKQKQPQLNPNAMLLFTNSPQNSYRWNDKVFDGYDGAELILLSCLLYKAEYKNAGILFTTLN